MATRKKKIAEVEAAPSSSYVELKNQYDELTQAIEAERARLRPEVIAHIRASMVEYDITVRDLVGKDGKPRRKRRTREEIEHAETLESLRTALD